jgi:membrane protein YqaA with SNARE-associated domain
MHGKEFDRVILPEVPASKHIVKGKKIILDNISTDNREYDTCITDAKSSEPKPAGNKRILKQWKFWIGIITVFLTLWLAISVVLHVDRFQEQANLSYLGAFLICIIGGIGVIPVPSPAVQFAMGAILNPLIVGIVSGIGSGIGGNLIFLLGRGGCKLFPQANLSYSDSDKAAIRWMGRIMHWARNRGSIAVFLISAIFNPVFVPMAMAIGTSSYKTWKFLVLCCAGNIVKSLFIAYMGYFGLGTILTAIGIEV